MRTTIEGEIRIFMLSNAEKLSSYLTINGVKNEVHVFGELDGKEPESQWYFVTFRYPVTLNMKGNGIKRCCFNVLEFLEENRIEHF